MFRRHCYVSSFSNSFFSDKIYQNGVRHSLNFHFSLLISKKRSKNGVKTLVWMIAVKSTTVPAGSFDMFGKTTFHTPPKLFPRCSLKTD